MATNNAVNNGLSSSTGSGLFVGSTSPTITTPRIAAIADTVSGATILNMIGNTSAVNQISIYNTATLNSPILRSGGTDADVGLIISTQGAGEMSLQSAGTSPFSFVSGTTLQHSAVFKFNSSSSAQTITFPDGNGTVAFVGDADFTWSTISGTTQLAVVDSGYVVGNAALTTITLPATMAVGQSIGIEGLGAGGWVLTANTGQTIKIGTTTTSSAGSLASVASSDNVYITCIVQDTTWRVRTTNSAGLTVT